MILSLRVGPTRRVSGKNEDEIYEVPKGYVSGSCIDWGISGICRIGTFAWRRRVMYAAVGAGRSGQVAAPGERRGRAPRFPRADPVAARLRVDGAARGCEEGPEPGSIRRGISGGIMSSSTTSQPEGEWSGTTLLFLGLAVLGGFLTFIQFVAP